MKKTGIILCMAALLVILGGYGISFAGSEHPEGVPGRHCTDLDFIGPDTIDILYGEFTVSNIDDSTRKVVHITLKNDIQKVLKNGKVVTVHEEHMFSFTVPDSSLLYYEPTPENIAAGFPIGECIPSDPLADEFYCYPYLLGFDLAFGHDGIPIIEELQVTHCEPGLDRWDPGAPWYVGYPDDDMIGGKIVIRVMNKLLT